MSYTYLFNLYDEIEVLIDKSLAVINSETTASGDIRYHQGRVDILKEFKAYLSEQMNPKLPRRMQKKMKSLHQTDA